MAKQTWSYPNRLDLASLPTPLQALDRLTASLQNSSSKKVPRLWIKRDDLTDSPASGNKIRKLEFLLAEALTQKANVIITCGGIQSNHCRATAILAAKLGLESHLILRGEAVEQHDASGNLLMDYLVGANISFYSKKEFTARIDDVFSELSDFYLQQGKAVFCIPTGGSNATGVWGYVKACEELKADFAQHGIIGRVAVVCASGSGGTQAGLIAGAKLHGLQLDVFGVNVCDDEAWFVNKIQQDLAAFEVKYANELTGYSVAKKATVNIFDGYVGRGYGFAGKEIFDVIKTLARVEGIFLDPVYTAKAFYGLLSKLELAYFDSYDHVIFMHTGGLYGLLSDQSRDQFT